MYSVLLQSPGRAHQNEFEYKVLTRRNDNQNLKADSLRGENTKTLNLPTVELFLDLFITVPGQIKDAVSFQKLFFDYAL